MADDKEYMRQALAEAEKAAALGEVPIGAVLVDAAGTVVAAGHNMRELWQDGTAHAEVVVIRAAGKRLGRWRLSGCTLYVTVEPCPMCAGAIVMSRIDRLVYGVPDARAGAVESIFNIPGHPSLNHQVVVRAGVLEDECAALVKSFFAARRGKKKSPLDE